MESAVPEDSGVMRCICGFDHDDDFTIQCEQCNTWQHAVCVDIYDESSIPDKYKCSMCSSREVDPVAARERQMKLLVKAQRKSRGQPSQRGRKKRVRGDDDRDAVSTAAAQSVAPEDKEYGAIDKPDVYFVRAVVNTLTPAAERYWQSLPHDKLDRIRRMEGINALKPAALAVIRRYKPQNSVPGSPSTSKKTPNTAAFGLHGLGVTASQMIHKDRFVIEFTGEICLRQEYKRDTINQWHRLGCPKQGTLFVPHFPLAIDGRKHGSEALFFRRSRSPNVRFEPVVDENDQLRMLGFAIESIRAGTELTIAWDWAPGHPIYKMHTSTTLTSSESGLLAEIAKLVHEPTLGDCVPRNVPDWAATVVEEDEDVVIPEPKAPKEVKHVPSHRIALAAIWRENRPEDAAEIVTSITTVPVQNVWVPAQFQTAGEPPKKKRLSLADYKRKFSN